MKRQITVFLVIVICIFSLTGCAAEDESSPENDESEVVAETKTIVISGPKAPPTFPILRMIQTNALGSNVNIEFKIWNSVEELLAIATGEEYGFLALPVNVSAKLYNKGVDLKLTHVDTWGVMYLSTSDENCNNWEDLKDKKLYVPYKSAPPDIVTQHYLNENGLKPGENVEIVYSTPPEIAQLMKAGEIEYAMNIEPFITASMTGNENVRVILDYMEEWKKLNGEEYDIPNAGIATTNQFLEKNEDLVVLFEKEYEKALKWTLENPKEAGTLIEEQLGLNAVLIEKAMPTLGLNYKGAEASEKDLEKYYEVLLNFKAESIGGKTPDEDYYYTKK